MAAPGEGDIAAAVAGNDKFGSGGGGKEQDFVSDLDRKKAEQQEARDKIRSERQAGAGVGGSLGQTGGPANPVDQAGYPNGGV